MTLAELLHGGAGGAQVTAHLGALSGEERRRQCLALGLSEQRRLWEAISAAPARAGELVPGESAVYAGRNTLALFSRFEKWFARQGTAVVGRNRHPLQALIGPGYFTVRERAGGGLDFDYAALPARPPSGWPPVKPNTGGLARPVYGDLSDRVLWMADGALVGAAYRNGKPLDSYFVLVRS